MQHRALPLHARGTCLPAWPRLLAGCLHMGTRIPAQECSQDLSWGCDIVGQPHVPWLEDGQTAPVHGAEDDFLQL